MDQLEKLKQILDEAGAQYEIFSHDETIVSASDGVESGFGSLEEMAPTFILNTERGYLTAIISGKTRLSYKKIKKALGLKNVSLASPEAVIQATGAQIGYVSLINPGLVTIIDSAGDQQPAGLRRLRHPSLYALHQPPRSDSYHASAGLRLHRTQAKQMIVRP